MAWIFHILNRYLFSKIRDIEAIKLTIMAKQIFSRFERSSSSWICTVLFWPWLKEEEDPKRRVSESPTWGAILLWFFIVFFSRMKFINRTTFGQSAEIRWNQNPLPLGEY